MKCLAKEPRAHYSTAAELADDLQRFQAGEPIRARHVSSCERLARWCRRRPLIAALILAVCLTATIGLAGITWQWQRANQNARVANDRAIQTKRALELVTTERERVATSYQRTRAAVNRMVGIDRQLADQPYVQVTRLEAMQEAVSLYLFLLKQDLPDTRISFDAASAMMQTALLQQQLGQLREADATLAQAIDTFREVGLKQQQQVPTWYWLEVADWHAAQSELYRDTNQLDPAEREARHCLEIRQWVAQGRPQPASRAGLHRERRLVLVNPIPDREERRLVADAYRLLGQALAARHDATAADQALIQAGSQLEVLARQFPNSPEYRAQWAQVRFHQALVFRQQQRDNDAQRALRHCVELLSDLSTRYPAIKTYQKSLQAAREALGEMPPSARPARTQPIK